MLHLSIDMSNVGDTGVGAASERPLNARSLALSALLGTHPPTLPASSLVRLAELFGMNGGTMRTALSRMAAAGDVIMGDGGYSLAPRLRQRQAAQDAGLTNAHGAWDGSWHLAVALADQRELADRRQIRAVMANARFAEVRPTAWMRPSNLPAPDLGADWAVTTGPIVGRSDAEIAAGLWDLGDLATRAHALVRRLEVATDRLDRADPAAVPPAFTLSAVVVRFLRSEPLLPEALTPPTWPLPRLRDHYARFEADLHAMLRPILRPR